MQALSSKITGFLEYIPRTHFKHLQRLHYKSLYSFEYEDPADDGCGTRRTYYFILFGPLSLCNSNDEISVSFFNFDDRDGSLLLWRSSLYMAAEKTDNDLETCTAFQSTDRLKISDATLGSDGESYNTYDITSMSDLKRVFKIIRPDLNREKVEYYVKVVLHHRSKSVFTGHVYDTDEEVFVKYNLRDQLIL